MPNQCVENGEQLECSIKGLVEGVARGSLLIVRGRISFYGEVDVERCSLLDGRLLAGRILVFKGSRGSTVGPYILYSLARRGCAPRGLVVCEAEPMLVAGAVLADIPLATNLPCEILETLRDDYQAELEVNPPNAKLVVRLG